MSAVDPALIAAIAALVGALGTSAASLAQSRKTLGEVRAMRPGQDEARDAAIETKTQMTDPNGGSTVRAALMRLEAGQKSLSEGQSEIRSDVRGIRHDIGRLSDADVSDREQSRIEHGHLWDELRRLGGRRRTT